MLIGASLGGLTIFGSNAAQEFAGACIFVDVVPHLEPEGVQQVLSFMEQDAQTGFASIEDVAKAVASYQPHRAQSKNLSPSKESLEGLKKNLRWREKEQRWFWYVSM